VIEIDAWYKPVKQEGKAMWKEFTIRPRVMMIGIVIGLCLHMVWFQEVESATVSEYIDTVEGKLEAFSSTIDKRLTSQSLNALFRRWFFDQMDQNKQAIKEKIYQVIDSATDISSDAKKALKAQQKLKYLEKHYQIMDNLLTKVTPIPDMLVKNLNQHPTIQEIDQKIYKTYMEKFETIYKGTWDKTIDVASLITSCDNNQRRFMNKMKNTTIRFKHKSLATIFTTWLAVIKGQMANNKSDSRTRKDLLLEKKTIKIRDALAPEYELLWLNTHYHIVNSLIDKEEQILSLFDNRLDRDKQIGQICDEVEKIMATKSYLSQFDKILYDLETRLKKEKENQANGKPHETMV